MGHLRFLAVLPLFCAALMVLPVSGRAQDINFDQIDKFESFGTGTLDVGSAPKTIIEDDERHTVILTIWEADAQTKVYWKSLDGGTPRTIVIPGRGVQTFQTAGEFKLEAVGDPYHQAKYGYVLLRLKK
jgi:secreted protein with Ig-like and vWFA domain